MRRRNAIVGETLQGAFCREISTFFFENYVANPFAGWLTNYSARNYKEIKRNSPAENDPLWKCELIFPAFFLSDGIFIAVRKNPKCSSLWKLVARIASPENFPPTINIVVACLQRFVPLAARLLLIRVAATMNFSNDIFPPTSNTQIASSLIKLIREVVSSRWVTRY